MAYFLIIVVETKALVQATLAPGSDPITLFKAISECNLAIHIVEAIQLTVADHPRRIGGQKRGLPAWPIDKVDSLGNSMLLVAVGAAGAREEISSYLGKHGKTPGKDYLFVA